MRRVPSRSFFQSLVNAGKEYNIFFRNFEFQAPLDRHFHFLSQFEAFNVNDSLTQKDFFTLPFPSSLDVQKRLLDKYLVRKQQDRMVKDLDVVLCQREGFGQMVELLFMIRLMNILGLQDVALWHEVFLCLKKYKKAFTSNLDLLIFFLEEVNVFAFCLKKFSKKVGQVNRGKGGLCVFLWACFFILGFLFIGYCVWVLCCAYSEGGLSYFTEACLVMLCNENTCFYLSIRVELFFISILFTLPSYK